MLRYAVVKGTERVLSIITPVVPVYGIALLSNTSPPNEMFSLGMAGILFALAFPVFAEHLREWIYSIDVTSKEFNDFSGSHILSGIKISITFILIFILLFFAPVYSYLLGFFPIRALTLIFRNSPKTYEKINKSLTNLAAVYFVIPVFLFGLSGYPIPVEIIAFLIFRRAVAESELDTKEASNLFDRMRGVDVVKHNKGLHPSLIQAVQNTVESERQSDLTNRIKFHGVVHNFNDFLVVLNHQQSETQWWSCLTHNNLNKKFIIDDNLLVDQISEQTQAKLLEPTDYSLNVFHTKTALKLNPPNQVALELLKRTFDTGCENIPKAEKTEAFIDEVKAKIVGFQDLLSAFPPKNYKDSKVSKFEKLLPWLADQYLNDQLFEFAKAPECCVLLKSKTQGSLFFYSNFVPSPVGSYLTLGNLSYIKKAIEERPCDPESEKYKAVYRRALQNHTLHLIINHEGRLPYERIELELDFMISKKMIRLQNKTFEPL